MAQMNVYSSIKVSVSRWEMNSVSFIYVLSYHCNFYRPQTKFAKVMFSQVSVCPQRGVCPIAYWDTLPPGQTPPGTRGRQPPPQTRDRRPQEPEADTPPGLTPPPTGNLPCAVHAGIRSTSGWYASRWNAFLYEQFLSESILEYFRDRHYT